MPRIPGHLFVEKRFPPDYFLDMPESASLWYEDPADLEPALQRGRDAAQKLVIILEHAHRILTHRQLDCFLEHFLNDRSYRQIASALGIHYTTVAQHVTSSISKLRRVIIAQKDPGTR